MYGNDDMKVALKPVSIRNKLKRVHFGKYTTETEVYREKEKVEEEKSESHWINIYSFNFRCKVCPVSSLCVAQCNHIKKIDCNDMKYDR